MKKELKNRLKEFKNTLNGYMHSTTEYSVKVLATIVRLISRLTYIIGKYAVTTLLGNKSQRVTLFADLVSLADEVRLYKGNSFDEEEKSVFKKILDELNGIIDDYFPEERAAGFQQFKIECTKNLYKRTYKENAFTKGQTYLVLKDWEGNYDVEDNLGRAFNFNHDGSSVTMYKFNEYFNHD